jgi:hypothetical protein
MITGYGVAEAVRNYYDYGDKRKKSNRTRFWECRFSSRSFY